MVKDRKALTGELHGLTAGGIPIIVGSCFDGLLSLEAEGPVEHFVPVSKIPPGIEFPADLKLRIRYDPIRLRLVYQGFMSKREFDRLLAVSDDWGYRRALEDLFRISTLEEQPKSGVIRRLGAVLGLL